MLHLAARDDAELLHMCFNMDASAENVSLFFFTFLKIVFRRIILKGCGEKSCFDSIINYIFNE